MMVRITGVPLKDLVREMMPFHAADDRELILITYVPWLTLVLPRLMGYKG